MPSRPQVAAASALSFTLTLCVCVLLILMFGCAPRQPDPALMLWEQPAPGIAAQAHALEKGYLALSTTGKSMEPLIVEGDFVVVDPNYPFANLRDGDVILYKPDWHDGLVLHACAARSGEAWIVHGINNAHYENGPNGGLHVYARHYRGRMVQGYTRRAKP